MAYAVLTDDRSARAAAPHERRDGAQDGPRRAPRDRRRARRASSLRRSTTRRELIGCDGHGGPSYHERIAQFLAGELSKRLGW